MTIVDNLSVSYTCIEELLKRKDAMEVRTERYIKKNPEWADRFETTVSLGPNNRCFLNFKIIKD